MYHLLVTAEEGVWEAEGTYDYDLSRFLEYTDDEIAEAFKVLTPKHIETLKSWPCLFAYERWVEETVVRIGRLTSIEQVTSPRTIRFTFEFFPDIQAIPAGNLAVLNEALDIRRWEMNRTHWAIKNVDLLGKLNEAGLIAPQALAAPEPLPDTTPTARTATSLQEFIGIVLDLNVERKEVFYRGHSNQAYKLEPSLFRRDKHGNYLYREVEDVIYRELLVSNSIDFHNDNYTLDRLVRMQHFSLPTRLLDITSNPLIALYFACKANQEIDAEGKEILGEVIVFTISREQIKYFDSDTASCIANLARLSSSDKEKINFEIASEQEFNEQDSMRRLLHFVKEEKSFFEPRMKAKDLRSIICVKGKRSNDRISSQSGAFLLFGHETILDEVGTTEIEVTRIAVRNKANILQQLDQMNINESTVFPYIENSARYVADKFRFRPDVFG